MLERVTNEELERIWKEAAVADFKVMSHYLPERTEETQGKPSTGWPNSNPRPIHI
jgi:hypothetical protein